MNIKETEEGFDLSIIREDFTKVIFTDSLLVKNFEILNQLVPERKFFVLDEKIYEFYKENLKVLGEDYLILKGGDENKNLRELMMIIDSMFSKKVTKKDALVAIGGGIASDISGLASNLYFRGIDNIIIPTTLLGMIDAAVGGKVAINYPGFKNMIGSFYQPRVVIISPEFLDTLNDREFAGGMAEIIKQAVISSKEMFEFLEKNRNFILERNHNFLIELMKKSAKFKILALGENCYERNLSRPLNFGHCIGHPIEVITKYNIIHGEAVAIGMALATEIAYLENRLKKEERDRIIRLIINYDLPFNITETKLEELWEHISTEKLKRGSSSKLLFVLPKEIASIEVIDNITYEQLRAAQKSIEESFGDGRFNEKILPINQTQHNFYK